MATGRLHSFATRSATIMVMPLALFLVGFTPAMNVTWSCWLGLILTPDLDSDNGCIAYYHLRRVSPILERIWYYIWWPYSRMFQHRSFITHWPVVSTAFRLAYILWPLWLIFGFFLPPAWVFVGLCISDIIHWVMDWNIFSGRLGK